MYSVSARVNIKQHHVIAYDTIIGPMFVDISTTILSYVSGQWRLDDCFGGGVSLQAGRGAKWIWHINLSTPSGIQRLSTSLQALIR